MPIPRLLFAAVLTASLLFVQSSIEGIWKGVATFGEGKIKLLLYFSPANAGTSSGLLVNLDEGQGITIDKISLDLKRIGLTFQGTLSAAGNEIKGSAKFGERTEAWSLTRDRTRSSIADEYEKREYMIPMRDGIQLHTIVFS